MSEDLTKEKEIYAIATDPIYIGTGGYTIGRVDNTIVRDPITRIPKIPGSSVAGTWRYYVTLELISKVKDFQPKFDEIKNSNEKSLDEKIKSWCKSNKNKWEDKIDKEIKELCKETSQDEKECKKSYNWLKYHGNAIAKITCAGQDNVSGANIDSPDQTNNDGKTGHCGHCIVCKAFGYSKKDQSWQGMLLFSDLQILLFPVFTRFGVKWITSKHLLEEAKIIKDPQQNDNSSEKSKDTVIVQKSFKEGETKGYINLGWLNLPYKIDDEINIDSSALKKVFPFSPDDIVIVPEPLLSQIINSNLEVRTSVSIDPITGAAKEKALFTSEAIPRGTVFYGIVRAFDKKAFSGNDNLPNVKDIWAALEDSKKYYETLGIGGMTTRGFGRLKISLVSKGG